LKQECFVNSLFPALVHTAAAMSTWKKKRACDAAYIWLVIPSELNAITRR